MSSEGRVGARLDREGRRKPFSPMDRTPFCDFEKRNCDNGHHIASNLDYPNACRCCWEECY